MENNKSRSLTSSDVDPQGNVTLWDHGPTTNAAPDSEEYARAQKDADEWYEANGKGPIPVTVDLAGARHALEVDPERYSLDPMIDDPEVAAEIEKIQEKRAADKKAAEDHAAALQLTVDRKNAAIAVQARRRSAELVAKQQAADAATASAAEAAQKAVAERKRVMPKSLEPQPVDVGEA